MRTSKILHNCDFPPPSLSRTSSQQSSEFSPSQFNLRKMFLNAGNPLGLSSRPSLCSLLSPQVTSSTSTVLLTTQVLLTPAQISDSCSQLPPLTAPPSDLNVVILLCPMTSLVFWGIKGASIHRGSWVRFCFSFVQQSYFSCLSL